MKTLISEEKELHFRRQVDDHLAEISDLRLELAELKTTLETTNPEEVSASDEKSSASDQKGFDFETSVLVDEYEKCIRGMQDKIDEQNTTINSLIDQIDVNKSLSMRVAPEGEESNEGDGDPEEAIQGHLDSLVDFEKLTSTPNHRSNATMADELRSKGMIPKRAGPLFTDQEDRPSQTDPVITSEQSTQCELRNKNIEKQITELMNDLDEQKKILEQKNTELEQFKAEKIDFIDSLSDLHQKNDDIAQKYTEKLAEVETLRGKNAELDTKVCEQLSTMHELESEKKSLTSILEQKTAEMANLEQTVQIQQEDMKTMAKENCQTKSRVKGTATKF